MDRCFSPAPALVYMDGGDRSIWRELVRGLLRFGDRPLLVSGAFDCQQMDPPVNGLVGQGITKTSFPKIEVLITAGLKITC